MERHQRIHNLQKILTECALDAIVIDDTTDLYYLTGMDVSVGRLFVTCSDAFFFLDSRYFEIGKKRCSIPVLPSENEGFLELLKSSEMGLISTIAFDSERATYGTYEQLLSLVGKLDQKVALTPVKNPVKELRAIKDPQEIALLRDAASLGSEGYDFVLTLLKEGITEIEVANELEIFWKRKGSKGLAFEPIIAFGANSSMPHYRAGDVKLKKGDTVLIDIGVNLSHYHSDMTRVVFFGDSDPRVAKIYDIVLEAQLAALEKCVPGATIAEVDDAARGLIGEKGYGDRFTHGLGHGVGLEIHELPVVRNKSPFGSVVLQPGMVITIEPGIYLPEVGGVRIEDTIVITETGHENLTNRVKNR